MSAPKKKQHWVENWQNSFDDGFYDSDDGAPEEFTEKKAFAVRTDAQGKTKVVGMATGADAERMISEAKAGGVKVQQNAAQVEQLMSEQSGATGVPTEVYQLMSTVIGFVQELSEEWKSRNVEDLGGVPIPATEIEFTMKDVK